MQARALTIELLNVDCMEYMATLPDNAFDLAIVDPPYGIGVDGQKGCLASFRIAHEFKGWDSSPPSKDYFEELARVSKNQVIWGANHFLDNLPNPMSTPCWIIWDKMQEFSGAVFEMAWTSFSSPAKAFRMSRVEAYTGVEKIHPTQKPVKLYDWLLSNYANQGDRILDTHLGSGSSAIAAHYGGFDFVGCELDEDYYKAAQDRFERETAQVAMF